VEERGELSKRIDDLHKRFDDVNRRFDDLNQRFTTLMWVIISYFSFLTLLTVVFKFLRV
jgi:hypothetical protein